MSSRAEAFGSLTVTNTATDAAGNSTTAPAAVTYLPASQTGLGTDAYSYQASFSGLNAGTTYRYDGSLTTPPCSEDVKWFVMTTPIALSGPQIGAFTGLFHGNNRPVQPLNGRFVILLEVRDRLLPLGPFPGDFAAKDQVVVWIDNQWKHALDMHALIEY